MGQLYNNYNARDESSYRDITEYKYKQHPNGYRFLLGTPPLLISNITEPQMYVITNSTKQNLCYTTHPIQHALPDALTVKKNIDYQNTNRQKH